MLVHWSGTQEIYFLSWWASELHRNHLSWYQSHPAPFSGVLDEIRTMTPLTFNFCIYQHSGACCQAAFWVYLSILTTWVQSLEPVVEERPMLISSLAVQVFHCRLCVHFFLLGMMPQSHQSWGLSASFYLFLESVILSTTEPHAHYSDLKQNLF